jgi:hypothetical protein
MYMDPGSSEKDAGRWVGGCPGQHLGPQAGENAPESGGKASVLAAWEH